MIHLFSFTINNLIMKKKIYFKPNAKVRQLVIDGAPLLAGSDKQQIKAGGGY